MSISNNRTEAPAGSPADAMAEYKARPRQRAPTHPGTVLAHALEDARMSAREAARRMGVSVTVVTRIMNGGASVTPEMALRLGTFLGNGPELWMGLQVDHDLWRARQALAGELAKIVPVARE